MEFQYMQNRLQYSWNRLGKMREIDNGILVHAVKTVVQETEFKKTREIDYEVLEQAVKKKQT